MRRRLACAASTIALLLLAACKAGAPHAPAIGQAYVGPATLKIRSDLPMQSAVVATVKHGDRLDIVQRRRIFLRVRTSSGAEGWTEARQLLSAADMASLRSLSERAAAMPVQGQAISYYELHVHTQPSLQAASFLQVKAKERFDVLGQVTIPRTDLPREPLIQHAIAPKKAPAAKKEPSSRFRIPPPPLPKPPHPPADWVALSRPGEADETESQETPEEKPAKTGEKPVPTDRWSLVRLSSGQTGWVLTRLTSMAIPDEVAQYAEGHRIVSYFSLGKIGDDNKDIWLWTTISDGVHPYDFDSIRVFVWSIRHHRYETAHIERNLRGYAPVRLSNVDYNGAARGKAPSAAGKYPGFSVCVENKEGRRVGRSYALLGNVVRSAGEEPCAAPAPIYVPPSNASTAANSLAGSQPPPAAPAAEPLLQRWKKRLKGLLHR